MGVSHIGNIIFSYYFNNANLHYYQVFTMFWATSIALSFAFFLVLTIALKLISRFLTKKYLNRPAKVLASDPNATLLDEAEKTSHKWLRYLVKFLDILFKISTLVMIFNLVMIFIPFSAFGEVSVVLTIFLSLFIYSGSILLWIALNISSKKDKIEDELETTVPKINFQEKVKLSFKRRPYAMGTMIVSSLFLSFFVPLTTSGACMNFYNKNYGWQFYEMSSVSSKFMRKFTIPNDVCPPGKPCHVYATLPEDTATQVFFNVHTSYDVDNITLNYDTLNNYNNSGKLAFTAYSNMSTKYDFDNEEQGKRTVHVVLLTGLEPATTYEIQIVYDNKTQFNSTYRTLPNDPDTPLTIAMGGDVGSESIAQAVTAALYDYNPDVAIVGGDVAYDNALQTCWYSWDEFFWMFEKLGNKLGKVLPIVAGVGNHDVGFDAGGPLTIDKENPPHYLKFMPQHLKPAAQDVVGNDWVTAVPNFNERRTYFHHKIGSAMFLSLDSDYVHEYSGLQMEYLQNVSDQYPDSIKFAYYHVPTYPCCVNLKDTSQKAQSEAELTWIPEFEAYEYLAIFENHVHQWKKTFALKEGKVVEREKGVTYFGDGNWGTISTGCSTQKVSNATGIIEASSLTNHVWMIRLNQSQYEIFPINSTGQQFYESWTGNINRQLPQITPNVEELEK